MQSISWESFFSSLPLPLLFSHPKCSNLKHTRRSEKTCTIKGTRAEKLQSKMVEKSRVWEKKKTSKKLKEETHLFLFKKFKNNRRSEVHLQKYWREVVKGRWKDRVERRERDGTIKGFYVENAQKEEGTCRSKSLSTRKCHCY